MPFSGLSPLLGRAARALRTPRVTPRDVAPGTLAETLSSFGETGGLVVSAAASDTAIFTRGDNFLFRGWHDFTHTQTLCNFEVAGEVRIARIQAAQAARACGDRFGDLVWLEIAGQALYFGAYGVFLREQAEWTRAALAGPVGNPRAFARFLRGIGRK